MEKCFGSQLFAHAESWMGLDTEYNIQPTDNVVDNPLRTTRRSSLEPRRKSMEGKKELRGPDAPSSGTSGQTAVPSNTTATLEISGCSSHANRTEEPGRQE